MLGQAGLHLHTFPEVAFRLDRWTMQGYPCVLDKTPNRQLDIHVGVPCLLRHCWLKSAVPVLCLQPRRLSAKPLDMHAVRTAH